MVVTPCLQCWLCEEHGVNVLSNRDAVESRDIERVIPIFLRAFVQSVQNGDCSHKR